MLQLPISQWSSESQGIRSHEPINWKARTSQRTCTQRAVIQPCSAVCQATCITFKLQERPRKSVSNIITVAPPPLFLLFFFGWGGGEELIEFKERMIIFILLLEAAGSVWKRKKHSIKIGTQKHALIARQNRNTNSTEFSNHYKVAKCLRRHQFKIQCIPVQHMLKEDVPVKQVVPSADVYSWEQSGLHSSMPI